MTWVNFLNENYETFENFKAFKTLVEAPCELCEGNLLAIVKYFEYLKVNVT